MSATVNNAVLFLDDNMTASSEMTLVATVAFRMLRYVTVYVHDESCQKHCPKARICSVLCSRRLYTGQETCSRFWRSGL